MRRLSPRLRVRGPRGQAPPVLARIPPVSPANETARAEAYDALAAQLQSLALVRTVRLLGVVGPEAGPVAHGLAEALRRAGLTVVEAPTVDAANDGDGDADYTVVRDVVGADIVVAAHSSGDETRPVPEAAGLVLTDVVRVEPAPAPVAGPAPFSLRPAALHGVSTSPLGEPRAVAAELELRERALAAREAELVAAARTQPGPAAAALE
jgi:hypothetical protein